MHHGHELPPLSCHKGHRKTVPPGSNLYERVLDDLRNALPSPPESPDLHSSLLCSGNTDVNGAVTVQFHNHSDVDDWEFQTRATRGDVHGDWLTPCSACSGSEDEPGNAADHDATRNERGVRKRGCSEVCDDWGCGDRVCVSDLDVEDVETIEMGHSPSLPHHHKSHHRNDNKTEQDETLSFPKHSAQDSKRRLSVHIPKSSSGSHNGVNSRTRSSSLPATTSKGHVISWSASCGLYQDGLKLASDGEDGEDTAEWSEASHISPSRLQPRVSSASQRRCSPSPSRTGNSQLSERRPHSSPPRNGRSRQSLEKEKGSQRKESLRTSKSPPRNRLFPDVHQTRTKSPNGIRFHSSSPSAAISQRQGSHEIPSPRHQQTWESAASPSQSPIPCSTCKAHVRFCVFGVDDDIPVNDDVTTDSLPEISPFFRPRSRSDVSMHVQRDGRLPRLPLLRKRSRVCDEGEEEEGENSVHVHWADEQRGSPLATSVFLSSLRPRALSHGSAELPPRKPILKKPLGF